LTGTPPISQLIDALTPLYHLCGTSSQENSPAKGKFCASVCPSYGIQSIHKPFEQLVISSFPTAKTY
jgi:hypothetical protein